MVKLKGLIVHTRLAKWGRTSVNTGVAAIVNTKGESVQATGVDSSIFIVNKNKIVRLKVKQIYRFKHGGYIKRLTKQRYIIVAANKVGVVDVYVYKTKKRRPQSKYINVVVKVKNQKLLKDGLCVGKRKCSSGIFRRKEKCKALPKYKRCNRRQRLVAIRHCRLFKRKNKYLPQCIIDLCNGINIRVERILLKQIKDERKRRLNKRKRNKRRKYRK